MATLEANNSYWAQKLLPFKDAGLLTSRYGSAGEGVRTFLLQTAARPKSRPPASLCVGALSLVAARYFAKESILIAESPSSGLERQSPLFYAAAVAGDLTVDSFIAGIDAEIRASRAHGQYSFEKLAALLALNREAIFQIRFSQSVGDKNQSFLPAAYIELSLDDSRPVSQFALSYDSASFSPQWSGQFGRHCLRAFDFLTGAGSARLSDFDLASEREKHLVAERFNQTDKDYPADTTLHELLETQAAKSPDSPAVIFDEQKLTYRELNERANQLAHFLRESLNVRAGDIVGAMMSRSEKMVVALLAIMKAGAAYVPINPQHPWGMISYMVENARIKTLLIDSESASQAASFDSELFIVDIELDGLKTLTTNPRGIVSSSELAYVIYTSGSTGRPKGVAVEHRAIVNTIRWRNEFYRIDELDVNLQMPSFAFDSSVLDIFCVLVAGGCLLIPREEQRLDAQYLKELIISRAVTRLILTPSYYRVLMKELGGNNPLRSITVAGEATTVELVESHSRKMPGVTLYNEYGPTENAVCSTACVLRAGTRTVSIGRPISNVKVFILDENLKLQPRGVPGEIHLGGTGLARGYLNQESLTEERFIPSPIPEYYAGRLYRTGDWGYWQPNGELEFVGRIDNQVKIRGFRVELEEIETRILNHPAIEQAAVVHKDVAGSNYLAAYLAVRDSTTANDLREYLRAQLPHYMVPEVITVLSQLPLTLNGKVDRARLKSLSDQPANRGSDLPMNEMECALAVMCADLLRIGRPGSSDNLFEHGLNSLKVMEMVSRIRSEIGAEVSLLDIYTSPTIHALSRRIGAGRWSPEVSKTATSI